MFLDLSFSMVPYGFESSCFPLPLCLVWFSPCSLVISGGESWRENLSGQIAVLKPRLAEEDSVGVKICLTHCSRSTITGNQSYLNRKFPIILSFSMLLDLLHFSAVLFTKFYFKSQYIRNALLLNQSHK